MFVDIFVWTAIGMVFWFALSLLNIAFFPQGWEACGQCEMGGHHYYREYCSPQEYIDRLLWGKARRNRVDKFITWSAFLIASSIAGWFFITYLPALLSFYNSDEWYLSGSKGFKRIILALRPIFFNAAGKPLENEF